MHLLSTSSTSLDDIVEPVAELAEILVGDEVEAAADRAPCLVVGDARHA